MVGVSRGCEGGEERERSPTGVYRRHFLLSSEVRIEESHGGRLVWLVVCILAA